MDKLDKILLVSALVCILALIGLGSIIIHDNPIMSSIVADMKLSYYIQTNDSMTNIEKYDLALSISEQGYDDMLDKCWAPIIGVEKEHWIKSQALELITGGVDN